MSGKGGTGHVSTSGGDAGANEGADVGQDFAMMMTE